MEEYNLEIVLFFLERIKKLNNNEMDSLVYYCTLKCVKSQKFLENFQKITHDPNNLFFYGKLLHNVSRSSEKQPILAIIESLEENIFENTFFEFERNKEENFKIITYFYYKQVGNEAIKEKRKQWLKKTVTPKTLPWLFSVVETSILLTLLGKTTDYSAVNRLIFDKMTAVISELNLNILGEEFYANKEKLEMGRYSQFLNEYNAEINAGKSLELRN